MEKREVEEHVRDICLSYFRKQWMEYTGERKICLIMIPPSEFIVSVLIFFLTIMFLPLILPPFFHFPATMLICFFFFRRVSPQPVEDLSHCFSPAEEPIVVEFTENMPELSFAEIQIIKSIRLAFLSGDKDQLLRSLSECRSYPGLSRWSFIEWLSARIPVN